jgi:phosphatidylserine decarboxylase
MFSQISAYLQYIYPQHLLTELAGQLANSPTPWLKNYLISNFVRSYRVDMSSALIENPLQYATFNDFFTRKLKPELRPIAQDPEIASPVDGKVAQIGVIKDQQLLQAKNFYYDLKTLLGNDAALAETFNGGSYTTLYLAPHNYHRIHMPLTGTLQKAIFVPGKLFSVNQKTSHVIPQLFTRNERLISVFDTEAGPMAVILVGAIIVGSIQMIWQDQAFRASIVTSLPTNAITLAKGTELGLFKLGSTVILLFGKNKISWSNILNSGDTIEYGSTMGSITS